MLDEAQQKKFERMTNEPVGHLVNTLAAPTIVSMLITALYNIADTFFVSQLGSSATGAIGVTFSLMALIQAVGFGFGHGSGNYISRKLGEKNVKEAATMAIVGFVSSFLLGLLILVVGFFFMPYLAMLLGSTVTIRPYAEQYMFFILLGAPFFSSSLTLNNQLRLQGNAQKAMIGITSGAILNCIFDPILIFGFKLGVSGAGLSTFISQVVSFLFLLYQTEHSDAVSLRFTNFRPTRTRYIAILQGGIPSLSRQSIQCIANVFFNHAMKFFGDDFFAAMTIVMRLSNFLFAGTTGIGQGFQPVCGFNYGARRYDRVRGAYLYTQRLALYVLCSLTILLALFAPQIIGLFSNVADVIRLGTTAQRWQCISIPFIGFCIVTSMLLQNINKYKQATIMALSRSGIFLIPTILILPHFLGMLGVMLAQPVADICSFALAIPMQRKELKELNTLQKYSSQS
ncbi:MAG: MATE family efflux transporter [Bacteroidaceae bacterium]|jgi:putative MATE family efflux protein|nr:MATE family efflux transporter [Bacteroidaceae bacterium]